MTTFTVQVENFPRPLPQYSQTDESQFRRNLERSLQSVTAYIEELIQVPESVAIHAIISETAIGDRHSISGGVDGYVFRATGATTAVLAQLDFSDLAGTASKAQLPAAIAYEDEANVFTLLNTFKFDTATVTDPTVIFQNLDSTSAVHTILQRYQFSTTAPATVTAAEWIYSQEQIWTSTGTTQDTKASLWLAQDGSQVEVLRLLGSDKSVEMFGDLTVDGTTLFVDSVNNRVGMGTASPERILHLSDSAFTTFGFTNTSNGVGNKNFQIQLRDTTGDIHLAMVNDAWSAVAQTIAFRRSNGHLGIHQTSPDFDLHLGGAAPAIMVEGTVVGRLIVKDSGATSGKQSYDIVSFQDELVIRQLNDAATAVSFNLLALSPGQLLTLAEVETITGAVTDGYASGLRLDPGYTAATALTVTRHNYIEFQDVSLAGVGPAFVTDAAAFSFDAAAGTHKALTSDRRVKINENGTLGYMPYHIDGGPFTIPTGIRLSIVTKTANYTATVSDHTILCDASSGAFTITLPAVATAGDLVLRIKKIDSSANAITIDGDGTETIDGDLTASLSTENESIDIHSDSSSWYVL